MATLSVFYKEFLSSLSKDEQGKYWANYEEDVQTKEACSKAGLEWEPEVESSALRFLKNLKKRKDLERNQLSESVTGAPAERKLPFARNISQDQRQPSIQNSDCSKSGLLASSSSLRGIDNYDDDKADRGSLRSSNPSRTGDEAHESDSENESDDNDSSDCESYANYMSVTPNKDIKDKEAPPGAPRTGTSVEMAVKKFPGSAFRQVGKVVDPDGLFSHISIGYIRGQPAKVKRFHAPIKGIQPNCRQIEIIRKIFQLEHRNLIPMLGMIDVGINECPQLVYASEEDEVTLVEYLHNKDLSNNPKGYATFGKFSLDIISACEYLYKNGIVHGSLAASSIVVRRAYRSYGNKERKLHLNSFLTDYGIIELTDGGEKRSICRARNGKLVRLRWIPKEILEDAENNYTFESDVWAFGVVLWEMWSGGDVPYGKNISNKNVEKHILADCHPLTFNKPSTCPQHIVDVMRSIFSPASERPTFLKLKQTFEEFRKHKYERGGEGEPEKEMKPKPNPPKKLIGDEKATRPGTSSSSSARSPAYSRYQRVRQWQNQSTSGTQLKRENGGSSRDIPPPPPFKGSGKERGRTVRSSEYERGRTFTNTNHQRKDKGKVAVVCLPVVQSRDNDMNDMMSGINQIQNHVKLAQALAAFSVATRQNSGSNNVNVNIDGQRYSREQNTGVQPKQNEGQNRRGGGGFKKKFKKSYYNKGNSAQPGAQVG